jgi:hypothetical protein
LNTDININQLEEMKEWYKVNSGKI